MDEGAAVIRETREEVRLSRAAHMEHSTAMTRMRKEWYEELRLTREWHARHLEAMDKARDERRVGHDALLKELNLNRVAVEEIRDFMKQTRRIMLESTSASNRSRDSQRAFAGVIVDLRETVGEHSAAAPGLASEVQGLGVYMRGLGAHVQAFGSVVHEIQGETRAQSDGMLTIIDRLDRIVERLDRRNGDV